MEEKKRSIKFEDGVVLYFFFFFLSVDYRNCPQRIMFGYIPLILLLFLLVMTVDAF